MEDVFRWLERVLDFHGQLTDFLGRLQGGAFIHASVESLLLVRRARSCRCLLPIGTPVMQVLLRPCCGCRSLCWLSFFRTVGRATR